VKKSLACLLLSLLLSAAAFAQLPDAPSAEKAGFFDPINTGLLLADVTTKVTDARYAIRAHGLIVCQPKCFQPYADSGIDPILKPAVKQSNAAAWGAQAGLLGLETLVAYELHHHEHRRIARGILAAGTIYSLGMAVYSEQKYHIYPRAM